jgi:hypothetical protein
LADGLLSALTIKGVRAPENARLLATIRWSLVLTTNYDDWFYQCFNSYHADPKAVFHAFSKLIVCGRSRADCTRVVSSLRAPDNPILWAIQGFLEGCAPKVGYHAKSEDYEHLRRELVIGHEEYRREAYLSIGFRRAFADVFRNRTLLFIGSNLSEPYVLNLFDEVLELHGPISHSPYAIVEDGKVDSTFLRDRLQIRCIEYEKGKYDQVTGILEEISNAIGSSCPHLRKWSISYPGVPLTTWESQFRDDINIIQGIRPPPAERVCMAFSAGFWTKRRDIIMPLDAKAYIKKHFQIANVKTVRADPEDLLWQLTDEHGEEVPACLVAARGGISKSVLERALAIGTLGSWHRQCTKCWIGPSGIIFRQCKAVS